MGIQLGTHFISLIWVMNCRAQVNLDFKLVIKYTRTNKHKYVYIIILS